MEGFDLLVIGGGPGGYLCAERAAAAGYSVALFEPRKLGGTCLNEGCVPTKAMLHSAKLLRHTMQAGALGVTAQCVHLDHEQVLRHKEQVVGTLVAGVEGTMKRGGVRVISARARIRERRPEGFVVEADGAYHTGRRLVVACGSETVIPPVPGLREGMESGFVVTSREALTGKQLPETMAVVGGGVIGLELASYFAAAGVKVTVVEMLPKIAGAADPEISRLLQKECEGQGIEFRLDTRVLEVGKGELLCQHGGQTQTISCGMVLLAVGRRPATDGLGLEALGVVRKGTAIQTDRHLQTNVPGLYAVGDCNGINMLAHTAYREAEVAVSHMLGRRDEMRYESVPSVIYTDPEAAWVGDTLDSARAKGIEAKEVCLPLLYSGRYVAEAGNGSGILKLVVDTGRNRLVGVHMLGSYASEIIAAGAMMLDTQLPPERLRQFVFPHPTVGEVIHEALCLI